MLRRLAVLFSLAPVVLLAACGASSAGTGADPAAAVPRGVPFYVEVTFRPEGGTRDGALAAAGKVLRAPDPEARIRELMQQLFRSDGSKVDFAKDIDPWVGDRGGLWVTAPAAGNGKPGVGGVVAVKDAELARTKIAELATRHGEKLTHHTVGDRSYDVDTDGMAVAVEEDYAIAGTEAEVKRSLAALDADGLDADAKYKRAIDPLTSDRLAHYYIDAKAFVDAALKADPEAAKQLGPFQGMLGAQLGEPQAGSFSADGDRLVIESFSSGGGLLAKVPGLAGLSASSLLAELPADAWGALAVPKVGESLRTVFNVFAGALGGSMATSELQRQFGIDLEQDVFAWMGDAGLFVRGTTVDAVDGALVVQVTDEARAATSFGKIVGLLRTRGGLDPQPVRIDGAQSAFEVRLPDAPRAIVLARGNGRVVVGYGEDAAVQGLSASKHLDGSATLNGAKNALGGDVDPALFVAIAPVLALAEAGGASSDPDYQKAKRYLQALDVVAAGSKQDGDRLRSRFAVGLR
jgi:hypothetical protein